MNPAPQRPDGIAFGRFQAWPHRRDLLADGQPIKLGGRAFDVLMALIESGESFYSCKPNPERWLRPIAISGKRWTGRAGKALCPWNCAPLRVLRGCYGIRAAPPTRRRCFSQSMTGSRKGSGQPI